MTKKYPGLKAIEITYPNKIKTMNTITIKKNDFVLFLEIWSLKSTLWYLSIKNRVKKSF